MVVRFEVDACLEALPKRAPTSGRATVDDMIGQLGSLSLSHTSASAALTDTSKGNYIDIISAGQLVPQNGILEMTTRSERNALTYDWKENYPQLFLSQTPHHFLAIHRAGTFSRIEKRQLNDSELKERHTQNESGFKRLHSLLVAIQELVVGHGKRGRLTLVCKDGLLKVYERKSEESFLPDEVMERFGP